MIVDVDVDTYPVDEGQRTGKKKFGDGSGMAANVAFLEYIH